MENKCTGQTLRKTYVESVRFRENIDYHNQLFGYFVLEFYVIGLVLLGLSYF